LSTSASVDMIAIALTGLAVTVLLFVPFSRACATSPGSSRHTGPSGATTTPASSHLARGFPAMALPEGGRCREGRVMQADGQDRERPETAASPVGEGSRSVITPAAGAR
jgi:hypothetical protein